MVNRRAQYGAKVDPVLTEYIHGYKNGRSIADFVAPVVNVASRSATIIQFTDDDFAIRDTLRSPGDKVKQEIVTYGNQKITLHQHARAAKVPVEHYEEANEIGRVNLLGASIKRVSERIAQSWEKEIVDVITEPTEYETSLAIDITALPWSNPSSDPEDDVINANEEVRKEIGCYATRGVISADTYNALRRHPLFRDRIKYTSPQSINEQLLGSWFGLPGGIRVSTRLFLDETTGAKVDFMQGQMVLFYNPEDEGLQAGPATGEGNGIFMNVHDNDRATPSAFYTYSLSGYPYVEPEYKDKSCNSYLANMYAEQKFIPTALGSTGKIGGAALIYNAV